MAEANSNLNIIVKVRDEASATLSRMSNDVSDLGGSLNFAGDKAGILASALAAIGTTAVLKNAIGAFAEGEAQMARFDAIMKTLPPDLQDLRDQIIEVADKALLKFGFSSEDAAFNMARLLQATHDSDFAFRAFQGAMDLARAKGISLTDATDALLRSFVSGGRLLAQFGIQVDDHASKETILAAVMAQTSGQAEAHAKTLQGQLEILGSVLGEFSQALGGVFAPAIEGAIGWLTKFIEANGGVKEVIQTLMPVIVAFAGFLAGTFLVSVYAAAAALFSMIGIAAGVILAIGLLAAAATLFVVYWAQIWENAKAIVELFKMGVQTIWQGLVDFIKNTFAGAMNWVRDQLNNILAFFQSVISIVTNPIKSAQQGIADTYTKVAGALKGILGFAEGGVVLGPTLAMVGEAGPEAIIPLSKMGQVGGGSNITINLNGDFYTTTEIAETFGNELARIIKNQLNLAIRA